MNATWPTVVAALLAWSTLAPAQVRVVRYGDDRLTGIEQVDVLVRGALVAGSCAIAKTAIHDAAVRSLHAANLRATISEKSRSSDYSVVIDINVANRGTVCATAIHSSLVAEVSAIPEADGTLPTGAWGSLLVGGMSLIDESTLVMDEAVEHDAAVQRAIAAHVSSIAKRVRAANP